MYGSSVSFDQRPNSTKQCTEGQLSVGTTVYGGVAVGVWSVPLGEDQSVPFDNVWSVPLGEDQSLPY